MADASSESEEEYERMEYESMGDASSISEEDYDFRSRTFKTPQQREERRLLLKRDCMGNIRKKERENKEALFLQINVLEQMTTSSENSSENSDITLNPTLNEEVPEINLVDDRPSDIIVSDDDIYSDIDNYEMLEETITSLPFVEQLKQYANKTALNCVQVNELLKLIHNNKKTIGREEVINISGVPKTYKTLFNISNKKVKDEIRAIQPNHKLYYFGLAKQILFYLKQYPIQSLDALQPSNTLELIWNTDGMKLYQSRDESAWPILCYIKNLFPRKVFEVLLTTGTGKPNLEFINPFVDELKQLMQNGLVFKDSTSKERTFKIKVVAAVCDAPARADIKCIKHHNAYFGCDFCMIKGTYIANTKNGVTKQGGTMTFQGSEDWPKRTNENFRSQEQKNHHSIKENTPLLELDIDMIRDFPIDFMHGSGGTMKKLFDRWFRHPLKSSSYRITATNLNFLNERIKYISNECLPNIFPRKLRSTSEHQHYKFSEHKQFLLYTGKILLLDLMPRIEYYKKFVKYSTACSLMNDVTNCDTLQRISKNLIGDAIDGFQENYGDKFMTYSSHTNIHYPEIAAYHGSLATVSAYPFENHLRHLRKWVSRSSHQAMVTMVNGILRRQSVECTEVLQARKSAIYFNSPNNVYIDTNSPDVQCYEALRRTMDGQILLKCYFNPMNLYNDPIASKMVGCFKINPNQHSVITKTNDEVETFRRGFKICLNRLAGISELLKPFWVIHMVSHDEDEHIFA